MWRVFSLASFIIWANVFLPATPRTWGAGLKELAPSDRTFPRFLQPLPGQAKSESLEARPRFGRRILLTFDDGPDLVGTPMILDELNRRGLKGIFFVNGHHITRNRPEDMARRNLLRKLALHGHLVGNHGLSHRNLCQERELMAKEIDGSAELVVYATGIRPMLFRSPYGARCRALDQALSDRDMVQVGWNLDPQEWKGGTEDAIVSYVVRELRHMQGEMILLLHDKNMAAVRALPRILDFIEAENRHNKDPIRVVDYRVFLPQKPLPSIGILPLVQGFGTAVTAFDSLTRPW